jgi:hypothetical protein
MIDKRAPGGLMTRISAAMAASLLGLAMIGGATAADSNAFSPAVPEPGTDIPSVTVKFGMRPYADNTFYVIAMQKGWFKEAGIDIAPAPFGLKVTEQNAIALLLNGQNDISSAYCPLMLPTYKSGNSLKCIANVDQFLAISILANPALKLKTFKDYIAEGKSFEDAVKAALQPLEGKILITSPDVGHKPFEEAVAKISGVKWTPQILDDAKSLVLAKSGQIDFVDPAGAPIVYTLKKAGWVPLIEVGDLYKYAPPGPDSPVQSLVAVVGLGSSADYVNANPNTVLRFLSVVWRLIDAVGKDPTLYDLHAPYINSVAGTNLTGAEIADTINVLDPLSSFDDNHVYFEDKSSVLYYQNAWGAIIRDFVKQGVIPEGAVTPDQIDWGAAIWKQMVDLRTKTDELFKQAEGKTLDGPKQELLAKAKQYYEWFNFLDAYRFALAATS